MVIEKRIGATRRAVELAREIVARGILTEEEAEAILRCGNNPRSILRIARKVYKNNTTSKNNRGGKHGEKK
jgi:hypothetical protein